MFIGICIIMSYLHREDEFLSGANGNAMSYINDVHPANPPIIANTPIATRNKITFSTIEFLLFLIITHSLISCK